MKKSCYELVFKTKDGVVHNLIFSSLEKASTALNQRYFIGCYFQGKEIISSSIDKRILF